MILSVYGNLLEVNEDIYNSGNWYELLKVDVYVSWAKCIFNNRGLLSYTLKRSNSDTELDEMVGESYISYMNLIEKYKDKLPDPTKFKSILCNMMASRILKNNKYNASITNKEGYNRYTRYEEVMHTEYKSTTDFEDPFVDESDEPVHTPTFRKEQIWKLQNILTEDELDFITLTVGYPKGTFNQVVKKLKMRRDHVLTERDRILTKIEKGLNVDTIMRGYTKR